MTGGTLPGRRPQPVPVSAAMEPVRNDGWNAEASLLHLL